MINNIQRGPLANALVLHDFKKDIINWKEWFYYVEAWFHKGGLIPNRISGISDKTVKFENRKKRLEEEEFESLNREASLWIGALPPDTGTDMFDGIFDVQLYQHVNRKKSLALCWDDQIIKFDRKYLENLAKDLYRFFEPAYGYGYQRFFKHGPSFYPFGFSVGLGYRDEEDREAKQIGRWGKGYGYKDGDYQTGMLRDIYPINFLSQAHFEHKIEEQSLKTWIESSPNHGELNKLAENLWSWWIPEDKIDAVREKFIPTGLLLSY